MTKRLKTDQKEKSMAKCFVCQNGPPDGPPVYRVNETGVDGIWACRAHLPPTAAVDPQVQSIVDAVSGDSDVSIAECSACGKVATWGDYAQNQAVIDDWQDCGDEAYCPSCKTT